MKDPKIPPSMTIDGKPLRFCDVIRAREILRGMSLDELQGTTDVGAVMLPSEYEELCEIFNIRKG